jgi:hypothetical protein
VNQEGYPINVSYDGGQTFTAAPRKAIIGYYCGSLVPPPAALGAAYFWPDNGSLTLIGGNGNCYGPLNMMTPFGPAFEVASFSLDTPNTFSGWVGCRFTVSAAGMTLTQLGRWVLRACFKNATFLL